MGAVKVTTCCYCGTRAALVLKGTTQHELSCARCGAPLSRMKMLPNGPAAATAPAATPARPAPRKPAERPDRKEVRRPKKRKNRKGLVRKVFKELWDEIEDIFD